VKDSRLVFRLVFALTLKADAVNDFIRLKIRVCRVRKEVAQNPILTRPTKFHPSRARSAAE